MQRIQTLSDLVGNYRISPAAAGPVLSGYIGAGIGDSRVSRVGGPVASTASADDKACRRSSDSQAVELELQLSGSVLNLACSGASISSGLLGPQIQGGRILPPQVARLKHVRDLGFVVVGPNDLHWTDLIQYCYTSDDCQDNVTLGEFDYRIASFDRDYGELLRELNDLPTRPQVIVMTSYDVFAADAVCADTSGPRGLKGLDAAKIEVLADRNQELNDVLRSGAEKYEFAVAQRHLRPLCDPAIDELGADLQGLADPFPFHPTGVA
jgi:hypothetical protein